MISKISRFFSLAIGVSIFITTSTAQTVVKTDWGGYVSLDRTDNLDESVYQKQINESISTNITKLREEGNLISELRGGEVEYRWPLRPAPGFEQDGYYSIFNFVDNDRRFSYSLQDYECGERTYDTPFYNHSGTDIVPWPFYWNVMHEQSLEVIAVAEGQIVGRQDGNFDRECDLSNTGENPNFVAIKHSDGTQTRYLHLQKNTIINKNIGDYVEAGEILGYVGSSGFSSGPHLHFEVIDPATEDYFDPYKGTCGSNKSRWQTQRPYYDSKINRISTHYGALTDLFDNCNTNSIDLKEEDNFCEGETVYLYGFFRDVLRGQGVIHRITDPAGKVVKSWISNFNDDKSYLAAAFLQNTFEIPRDAAKGTWKYTMLYEGNVYSADFSVCLSTSTGEANLDTLLLVSPNPAKESIQIRTDLQMTYNRIQILNVSGRVVYDEELSFRVKAQNALIPVSNLTSGIYMLALSDSQHGLIASRRFIKI